jgi:CDP-diacylglycerol--glycerol-3-phosphate 3-phosphatidyltransferase
MTSGVARIKRSDTRTSLWLPRTVLDVALWGLDHVARGLIGLGITANTITVSSVALAGIGGALLAFGHFGAAAVAMVIASLGDALDGIVARRTGSASVSGALLDASVDRYEEFLFLGGLAIYFRASVPALVLTLGALAGSFMVSYGSAKAEALAVPVPPGVMRRAERAVCLCAGVALTACFGWLADNGAVPAWTARAPLFVSLGLVAVVANVSAIRRLQRLARAQRRVGRIGMVGSPISVPAAEPSDPDVELDSDPSGRVVAAPAAVRVR